MSNFDTEYILMHVVGSEPEELYESWPLHVTLMPWFSGNENQHHLDHALAPIFAETPPFSFEKGPQESFGPAGDIKVDLVRPADDFRTLHQKIFTAFTEFNISILSSRYCGEAYTPHVSHKRGRQLKPETDYRVDHIAMFEGSSVHTHLPKKLIKSWRLGWGVSEISQE